jgi:hypothetical protein
MIDDGTESGTTDHETIATDGDEAGMMTSEAGKLETNETGTTTGETQVDGTVTIVGTLDGATLKAETTIAVVGTEAITDDGTESGTLVHETITADGDEAMVTTTELGKFETHETGTTTGDVQVAGTETTVGTKTNDEVGTET